MKKLFLSSLTIVLILTSLLSFCGCGNGISSSKTDLNLDGYELVFFDDFNGNSLDLDMWEYRKTGIRRGGINHPDQVRVEDGNLIFTAQFAQEEYGENWYSGMIRTKQEFVYGYYEIRCIPNKSECFWSAFWLTHADCYDHYLSQGGIYGAEIDIFESYKIHTLTTKNYVTSSIHCNGSDTDIENIDSLRVAKTYVSNLRSDYNTFGLLWTEDEYIFYINRKEVGRTSFGNGTSSVPECVIVSLEIPDEITLSLDTTTEYIVNYVKIYQIAE